MALRTHRCKHCGELFEAHDAARTAELGFCSHQCMNESATST